MITSWQNIDSVTPFKGGACMPKKSNAEKVWSNKLPKILKPVGCSFSDDEWNDFSSFFPVNGWDAYPPEPDKTGEISFSLKNERGVSLS